MAHVLADVQYSRDQRGLVTIVVPWWCGSFPEIGFVGTTNVPAGLEEVSRGARSWESETNVMGFRVDITYEGIETDGSVPEEKRVTYEYDSQFSEEAIESHPRLEEIMETYEGYEDSGGKVRFPRFWSATGFGVGLAGVEAGLTPDVAGRAANTEKNPMFGRSTYPEFAAVFRETRIAERVPQDLLEDVGTVVKDLPENFPTPDNKDWLILTPIVRQRGSSWEIVKEKLLSPRGGWPALLVEI